VDAQERGEREGGREGMRGFSTELILTSFGGRLHGLRREICAVWRRTFRERGEGRREEGRGFARVETRGGCGSGEAGASGVCAPVPEEEGGS
jgi:hypothetical protein